MLTPKIPNLKALPEKVSVQVLRENGYVTACCEQLPGFFLYDKDVNFVVNSIMPCLHTHYLTKYGLKVEIVQIESQDGEDIFPLNYRTIPIQNSQQYA